MSAGRSTDRGVSGATNEGSHYKRSSSPQVVRAGAYPYPREPPTSYLPVSPYGASYTGAKGGNDYHSHQFNQELLRRRPTMLQDYHTAAALARESFMDADPVAFNDALSGASQASASKKIKLDLPSSVRHHPPPQVLQQQLLPHHHQQQTQQQQQQQQPSQLSHRPTSIREQSAVPSWAQPLTIDTTGGSGSSNGGAACGSEDADVHVKEEPGYHPKIEAISPTLPTSSEDTKAELVQSIGRMDREISKVESQISQLKKKQQQLEEEASMPNTKAKEEIPEISFSQSKPLSVAQIVYTENRNKAQRAHNILLSLGPKVDLPLYNLPSDAPACVATCERFLKFKSKLIDMFRARHVEQQQQEKYMIDRYAELMQSWTKKLEAKTAKKKVKEQKNREYFERIFPELKKQRDDKDRFQSRVGSRSVLGYARTEAELEQIMDSLHEQEEEEKKMKAYAVIPPIMPTCNLRAYRYVNRNSLVEDPMAEHKEMLQCQNMWSDQEKETFREKYLQHPKNFVFIASYLPKKSVAECVRYYYLTKNAEKYKSLLKKQRAVNTKKRLPPRQQLRPFIKTDKDTGKNEDDEEADEPMPTDPLAGSHVSVETRGTGGCEAHCQPQQATNNEPCRDVASQREEPASHAQRCVACGAQLGSAPAHQHAVSRANCEAYGVKEADLTPDMRVCSTCWRNSVRRRYLQCPISSCKTPKRRVKRLRQLPLKWSELPLDLKDSLMKDLGVRDTVSRCCTACFARISKHVGNNPRTNEPFLPLAPDECSSVGSTGACDSSSAAVGAASRWTDAEVDLIKLCLRTNGKNWAAMAANLYSKTEHQCRSFYAKYKKVHHFDEVLKEYRKSKGSRESGGESTSVSEDDDNGEDNGESTDSCEMPGAVGNAAGMPRAVNCTDQSTCMAAVVAMDTMLLPGGKAAAPPATATAHGDDYDSSATASADESYCDIAPSGSGAQSAMPDIPVMMARSSLSMSTAEEPFNCYSQNCNENSTTQMAPCTADSAFMQQQISSSHYQARDSVMLLRKDSKPLKSVGDLIKHTIEGALTDRQDGDNIPAYSVGATDLSAVGAGGQQRQQSTGSSTSLAGDLTTVDVKPSAAILLHDQQQPAPQVFHPFASSTSRLYMGDPRDYRSSGESSSVRAPPPAHSHHQQAGTTSGAAAVQNRSPLQQQPQNLVSRGELKPSSSPCLADASAVSPVLSPYGSTERQPSRSPGCRIPPPPPLIQTRTQPSYPSQVGTISSLTKKDYHSQPHHLSSQTPTMAGGSITQGTPLLAATGQPLSNSSSHASPITRYDQGSISQGTPRNHELSAASSSKSRTPPMLGHSLSSRGHVDLSLGMPPVSSPAMSVAGAASGMASSIDVNMRAAAGALAQRSPYAAAARQLIDGPGAAANLGNPAWLSSSLRAGSQGLNFLDPAVELQRQLFFASSGMPFPSPVALPPDAVSQFSKATLQNDFFTAQQMKSGASDKDGKASPAPKERVASALQAYQMAPYYEHMALAAMNPSSILSLMVPAFDHARLMHSGAGPLSMQRDHQQQPPPPHQHLVGSHGGLTAGADAGSTGVWPSPRHMGMAGVTTGSLQNSVSPARMSASPLDSHAVGPHPSRTPTSQAAQQQYRRSAESPSSGATAAPHQAHRHPVIQGSAKEHAVGRDSPSTAAFSKYEHRLPSEREPIDYVKARRNASTTGGASSGGLTSDRSRALDAAGEPRSGSVPSTDTDQSGGSRDDRLTLLEQDRRTLAGNTPASSEQDAPARSEGLPSKFSTSHSSRNGPLQPAEFASNRLAELSREMSHGALHKDPTSLFSSSFEKDRHPQMPNDRLGESITAASLIDVIITKHINSDRPPSNSSDEHVPSGTSVIVPPPKKQSKRSVVPMAEDASVSASVRDSGVSPPVQQVTDGPSAASSGNLQPASRGITLADHINDIINRDYGRKAETPTSRGSDVASSQPRMGGIMTGSPVYPPGRSSLAVPQRSSIGGSSHASDSRSAQLSPRNTSAGALDVLSSSDLQPRSSGSPASGGAAKISPQSTVAETRYDLEPISDDSNGESHDGSSLAAPMAQTKQQQQMAQRTSQSRQPGPTTTNTLNSDSSSKPVDSGMKAYYAHMSPHMSPHEFFANAISEGIRKSAEQQQQQADVASSASAVLLGRHVPSVIASGYGARHEQLANDSYYAAGGASVVVPTKNSENQSKLASGFSGHGSSKFNDASATFSSAKHPQARPSSTTPMRGTSGSGQLHGESTGPQSIGGSSSSSLSRESPGLITGSMRDLSHHQLDRAAYHQLARHQSLTSLASTWVPPSSSGIRAPGRPTAVSPSPPPMHAPGYPVSKASQVQHQSMTHSPSGGFYGSLMSIASPGGPGASEIGMINSVAGKPLPPSEAHSSGSRGRDSVPSPFHNRPSKADVLSRQGRGGAHRSDSPQPGNSSLQQSDSHGTRDGHSSSSTSGPFMPRFSTASTLADGGHSGPGASSPHSSTYHQGGGSGLPARPSYKPEVPVKSTGGGGSGAAGSEFAAVSNNR